VLPGATITAHYKGQVLAQSVSNGAGWFLLSVSRSGRLTLTVTLEGFRPREVALTVEATRPKRADITMEPGTVTETVTVSADAASDESARRELASAQASPSQNVFNLQRRVVGVLPVRIDVPRAGTAYRFVRPLVLDETTSVSFDYRTR
jgi:hypothetical protein